MIPQEKIPQAVRVSVCSLCGLNWYEHQERARARVLQAQSDAWDWFGEKDTPPPLEESDIHIEPIDCIELLKIANRGPMGPQGPEGPMGMNAL